MKKYEKRFTKEEYQRELIQHLSDMPPGFLKAKDKLEKHAAEKAEHYERALKALDEATERLKAIRASGDAATVTTDADEAIRKIEEAVNAYGTASMHYNGEWQYNNEQ